MVTCVVKGCIKRSAATKKSDGVTFHLFPTNVKRKNIWIDFVRKSRNEPQWQPNQKSVVCSNHFDNNDLYITNQGLRRVIKSGYPKKILPELQNPAVVGTVLPSTSTALAPTQQKQSKPKGTSAGNSSCNISLNPDSLGLKVPAPETSEAPQPLDRCRFCAEYSKDCIDVTSQDRPYLTRNKTALTLNELRVELDFNNDALPTTVCGICDRKLQAMYDFFKQVKEAQESLIKVNVKEEIETVIVKTECECVMCEPTPKDKDNIDSKDGIIDSLTVTKTVMVKPYCNKRKSVKSTPETQKKPKIKVSEDIKSEESEPDTQKKPKLESKDIKSEKFELKMDIKEETPESVDSYEDYEAENPENDTETDVKPGVSGWATSALVNEMSDNETFS